MSIEDRKGEKPAHDRGTGFGRETTGAVAGRVASISPEAGKESEASPGAEADKERAEKS